MTNFLRRLGYYGIGFGIGMLFLIFFFKNRGCSWLPSNRVRDAFATRLIVLHPDEAKQFKQLGISTKTLLAAIDEADISFSASKKQGDLKVYQFETQQGKAFWLTMPTESFIAELRAPKGSIEKVKNARTGEASIVRFPTDKSLIYFDSTDHVACLANLSGYKQPALVLKALKSSGRIDFSKTNFNEKPKPTQYLTFRDVKGQLIGIKAYWYKEKVCVFDFKLPFPTTCK